MEENFPMKNVTRRNSESTDSKRINTEERNHRVIEIGPPDTFLLVHLLFLLLGIMHLLPTTFFVTANDYWMYKFRSISSNNTNDRSDLQSNFASGSNIASTVPSVVCMVLATVFGYKMKLRTRILASLFILAASLAVSTIFINVDTDEWQTGFFALTMLILAIMNGIMALFQVSTLALVSKLPPAYLKTFLVGQGVGGIFTSSLQVLSLAVGTSSKASALVYFLFGTLITSITLVMFYYSKNSSFYNFHYEKNPEDTKKDIICFVEFRDVSKKIWSSLAIGMAGALAYAPTHPAIAALVVSEFRGNENDWNEKYFVAVVTFLYSDICSVIGRVMATSLNKRPSDLWLVGLSISRIFFFVPLFMFCNTLPRNHLPVLFPHDWQYVIILGSFMISSGYFFNIAFMNVTRLAPENEETSYLIMQTFIGIVSAAFSPLGVLCVELL
nr:equilibrative nucleoside transporter 3-like isoform X2 [Leptinotarsa decemlineata]